MTLILNLRSNYVLQSSYDQDKSDSLKCFSFCNFVQVIGPYSLLLLCFESTLLETGLLICAAFFFNVVVLLGLFFSLN